MMKIFILEHFSKCVKIGSLSQGKFIIPKIRFLRKKNFESNSKGFEYYEKLGHFKTQFLFKLQRFKIWFFTLEGEKKTQELGERFVLTYLTKRRCSYFELTWKNKSVRITICYLSLSRLTSAEKHIYSKHQMVLLG